MEIKDLNKLLASNIANWIHKLAPNAELEGSNYVLGGIDGSSGKSLKISPEKGIYTDFADQDNHGDLVDFWKVITGNTTAEVIKDIKKELGLSDHIKQYRSKKEKVSIPVKELGPKWRKYLNDRGITKIPDNVRQGDGDIKTNSGKSIDVRNWLVFEHRNTEGLIKQAAMLRYDRPEGEKIMLSAVEEHTCYGWDLVDFSKDYLVLCEGQIDALSYREQGINAVGSQGATNLKWIENDWDLLNRFSTLYISYDMDEAGKKGGDKVLERLGVARCKLIELPEKDVNDCLLAGYDLNELVKDAVSIELDGLSPLDNHTSEAKEWLFSDNPDIQGTAPWLYGQHFNFKIRPKELTLWTGYKKHGKSEVLFSWTLDDALQNGQKTLYISPEVPAYRIVEILITQIKGGRITSPDEIDRLSRLLDRFYVYEGDVNDQNKLFEVLAYAVRRYGVTRIVLDNLNAFGFPSSDYDGQQLLTRKLRDFARDYNCHVYLVAHARKPDRDSGEDKIPSSFDVLGSSSMVNTADNIIVIWRNRKKEYDANNAKYKGDTIIKVLDQRITPRLPRGVEHKDPFCQLYRDAESLNYSTDELVRRSYVHD